MTNILEGRLVAEPCFSQPGVCTRATVFCEEKHPYVRYLFPNILLRDNRQDNDHRSRCPGVVVPVVGCLGIDNKS